MPNYDTLKSQGHKFRENYPTCLPAYTPQEIKLRNVFEATSIERINYDSIAQACQVTEPVVIYILKQILHAIDMASIKDYYIKLNLRVGYLKFRRN